MTQYKRVLFSDSCVAYLMQPMRNDRNIPVNAVEDPYLQIRGGGRPKKFFGPSGLSLVEQK